MWMQRQTMHMLLSLYKTLIQSLLIQVLRFFSFQRMHQPHQPAKNATVITPELQNFH